jgi:hypothetical protein
MGITCIDKKGRDENLIDIRRFYLYYASLENSSNITNVSVWQPIELKKNNGICPSRYMFYNF